jgi:dTDP-4-amino-4,6-dideoxygalactose transaminase
MGSPVRTEALSMSEWRIPLSDLDFGPEEMAAVQRVMKSKWLSMGQEAQAFEKEFAAMQGAKHAIAIANATAGLHLAFLALDLGPNDEIIQPALNFVATANMTVAAGATPVFADIISLGEPTIDPVHVERLITPRTKAVVIMHYGGSLCRMAEFVQLCRKRGLALIEDACHAVGAAYQDARQRHPHGIMAGSIGDISAFSFFANKNIATGEGGMVVTNRDALAERVRLLRSHGMTSLTWDRHKGHASSYDVVVNGYNYRIDELRAALGRAQLAKLKLNNERRVRLMSLYVDCLSSLPGWTIPFAERISNSSGHLMVVVAPTTESRDRAVQKLRESRIQTSLHYPCISDFSAFATTPTDAVKITREFATRAITLPLFPSMTLDQVQEVGQILSDAKSNKRLYKNLS